MDNHGILYIVATPIGNLGDITQRALQILSTVDLIAAEDTRYSLRLLQHYGVQTPLVSLHEFNESKRTPLFLSQLHAGKNIALISDAGTPLISDPGYVLVHAVQAAGIKIVPVPGPCAAIAALSAAGLPTHQFMFVGFLSAKTSERQNSLLALKTIAGTLIFYEAPHRIMKLVQDISLILGKSRLIVLAKELTKTFETFFYGTCAEAVNWLVEDDYHQKGEFVVLVHGVTPQEDTQTLSAETLRILTLLAAALPAKQASTLAAQITGEKKNKLYAALTKSKTAGEPPAVFFKT